VKRHLSLYFRSGCWRCELRPYPAGIFGGTGEWGECCR